MLNYTWVLTCYIFEIFNIQWLFTFFTLIKAVRFQAIVHFTKSSYEDKLWLTDNYPRKFPFLVTWYLWKYSVTCWKTWTTHLQFKKKKHLWSLFILYIFIHNLQQANYKSCKSSYLTESLAVISDSAPQFWQDVTVLCMPQSQTDAPFLKGLKYWSEDIPIKKVVWYSANDTTINHSLKWSALMKL